ncbi:MAG: thiamine pyrophosphate-binding protein [Cytophagales bacterium]|nr:thiamine pyrophosphate-binding protein [Cytophagales bacterium]
MSLAGHLLIDCLIEQGVTHVFGVPGESFLACLDGIFDRADKIKFINCRQEGGAAFMAEAVGKLTGRPGVCFVTRGPGATNASIGVHTAFQDSTPMVLLVGDVASDTRDREAFQEVNYLSFFESMTKRVERVDDPNRVPEYIARAFATALNGRPGPVVLVLPEDMQIKAVDTTRYPVLARIEPTRAGINDEALQRFEQMLLASKRPFVIAGGAGWDAQSCKALQAFAEKFNVPVGNAFRFQDTFDNHHTHYAGDVGIGINPKLAAHIKDSDLIIALGPRLGEMTTGGYAMLTAPKMQQKLIHIHASSDELNRVYQADLAINASMDAAAKALSSLQAPLDVAWSEWTKNVHATYEANLVHQPILDANKQSIGKIDMPAIVAMLQKHLPPDAVLTNGAGNFASWVHRYFKHHGLIKGHKTQLAPTSGSMGYGVPAGIAANLTTGRVVLTMAGDGDFLMNGQELATAVQYGAKTIIVLLNNGIYGTIRMHQEREYPARVSGSSMVNSSFAALANAYGYVGVRITQTSEFEAQLLAALARAQGTVIEIMLEDEVLTTRASLSAIRQAALQSHQ